MRFPSVSPTWNTGNRDLSHHSLAIAQPLSVKVTKAPTMTSSIPRAASWSTESDE
jgi:hypothetical protein